MGWNASGDERVKRFKLYQELEAKYKEALEELQFHRAEIARKDSTIRHLAAELASMAAAEMVNEAEVPPEPESTDPINLDRTDVRTHAKVASRPPPRISGKLSVNEILSSLENQVSKKKGA